MNIKELTEIGGKAENLDELIKDENWEVRETVARQGRAKDLDVQVNDDDWSVRLAVAWKVAEYKKLEEIWSLLKHIW